MAGKKGRSGRKTARREATWQKVCVMGCEYIASNFHKFSQPNKIKVALEVMKKIEKSGVSLDVDIRKPLEINVILPNEEEDSDASD